MIIINSVNDKISNDGYLGQLLANISADFDEGKPDEKFLSDEARLSVTILYNNNRKILG